MPVTGSGKLIHTLLICLFLAACSESEPVRIGFIADLSDPGSDFGLGVRNSVILAIEQQNAGGGIRGRPIELIVRDDGQNSEQARIAAQELIELRPEVVIGPATSAMARIIVPMMNAARLTMISPTVAANEFRGQDDHFLHVSRASSEAGKEQAEVLYSLGARRVGLAYDTSNLAYTEGWSHHFINRFTYLGGEITGKVAFASAERPAFAPLITTLRDGTPDTLVFVANSIDTARLCQQARRLGLDLRLSTTEWASSGESMVELGGSAVDGLIFAHTNNRNGTQLVYQAFLAAYEARFHGLSGYSTVAYDTARAVISALERRRPGEDMKTALLSYGPYPGLQNEVAFDEFGDASQIVYFSQIRHGEAQQLP